MPQRRPHNKSRNGCDQCRKRRVKCDEQPPRCANCIARDEHCHFSRIAPTTALQTPQATPSPNSTVANLEPGVDPKPEYTESWKSSLVRTRELELMHQWCCYTYMSAGAEWHRLFKEYVGKEAIKYDYLMASILALSSFHLATEALDAEKDLATVRQHVSVGLEYQNQALAGLRIALETFTPDKSSPVLFTSIIVAACAIISPLLPAGPGDEIRPAAEAFLPLFYHKNSIESIKEATLKHLKGTYISNYVNKDWKSAGIEQPLCVSELRKLNRSINTSPWKHQVYENAISNLEKMSRREDYIAEWLVESGQDFLDELYRKEHLALAIYMHWGVLLDHLHDIWWAKFSGRRLVEELSVTLSETGPEWEIVSGWCRVQVGLRPIRNSGE
ncbi:hypothetical protein P280DRAFT_311806 [Massarina eburnea CBS 473.64]|uniref:Zn(2)-C6 fungal-type domain-containing protein n=1 Tax=Massarina eburnea CBS 473.64 TaxID=1395130 RepID=A0A6A6S217_9PLEO|nr:hypothetical protein P280DRAFT_311806 [Massarina eburnea CBS 473.64]